MARLPDAAEQLLSMHAPFIHAVVQAIRTPTLRPDLLELLREAESRGWAVMVSCVREILDGRRGRELLLGLDAEDRVIVEAILAGIDDPNTLPPLQPAGSPQAAAPGLAMMIRMASRGDAAALTTLANMAEQMVRAGGEMAKLGGIMRRLVNGERDADSLGRGMGAKGTALLRGILDELDGMTLH